MTKNIRLDEDQQGSGVILLTASLLVVSMLVLPLAFKFYSFQGVVEGSLAGVICLVTGCLALTAMRFFGRRDNLLLGVGISMFLRMLPPLAICLLLATQNSNYSYYAFIYSLLAYYMVALGVEVWVSIRTVESLHRTTNDL